MQILNNIGIFGASSFVGECLTPLLTVNKENSIVSFSRKLPAPPENLIIKDWISVMPISALPQYFPTLKKHGAKRIVALSSTSRFSKTNSSDSAEIEIARRLTEGEELLEKWARSNGIEWIILRPTLIYGLGKDKNITEIVRFIRRFGFFPILGKGVGLRQPIHVKDVALACVSALNSKKIKNHSYNITGSETLTYREMISRVFTTLNRPVLVFSIPLFLFKIAVSCINKIPRYKLWSTAMAERMNKDLVFDSSEAVRDFNFISRNFFPTKDDV